MMGGRRARPQLTATVLVINRRAGPKIPARLLIEFHTLLVTVRLFLHHVFEPIESPFFKIEGSPGSESHPASRSGKQSRLPNPSCLRLINRGYTRSMFQLVKFVAVAVAVAVRVTVAVTVAVAVGVGVAVGKGSVMCDSAVGSLSAPCASSARTTT